MPEPIAIRTTRYVCPHCSRGRSKRAAAEAHMARCWANPDVQSCRTCVHYDAGVSGWGAVTDAPAYEDEPPTCAAGCEVPDDGTPVTGCPAWSGKEES